MQIKDVLEKLKGVCCRRVRGKQKEGLCSYCTQRKRGAMVVLRKRRRGWEVDRSVGLLSKSDWLKGENVSPIFGWSLRAGMTDSAFS